MIISSCWGVAWQHNLKMLLIRSDIWLIHIPYSKANYLMSEQQQECSKKWTIKNNYKLVTLLLDGTLMTDHNFFLSIWVEHAWTETLPWVDQAVVSYTGIVTLTTSKEWVFRRQRHFAWMLSRLPWKEMEVLEVSLGSPTSLREVLKNNITNIVLYPSNHHDAVKNIILFNISLTHLFQHIVDCYCFLRTWYSLKNQE